MPIEVFTDIKVLTQSEFHAIDEKVMRIAFDVHNEFGRFLDEAVYKQAITTRCQETGLLEAEREVRMRISHETFVKDYYMDILFNAGAVLEAKTKETLTGSDRKQTLTYLFLTGLHHARLINLRPERVEHEFVSTQLTQTRRREFTCVDRDWRVLNEESAWLRAKLPVLLRDWGAFLNVSLYREAITHFLGGQEQVVHGVEVKSRSQSVGHQPTHLLTADTAFAMSALTEREDQLRDHQQRFLRHTNLQAIQWINFNHHTITFESITK